MAKGDKEKALSVISIASANNIAIKTFIALVLEKVRLVLLIKNAPGMAKELKENISDDDVKVLDEIITLKDSKLNSVLLLEFLKAYDATGRAYIESLPLELAVIAVCG